MNHSTKLEELLAGANLLDDRDLAGLLEAVDALVTRGNDFDGHDLASVAWRAQVARDGPDLDGWF